MSRQVDYLDLDDLLALAAALLGDPPPVRDVGLLGSAAARPQTTLFGEDAYPDLWGKAAALLQSIVKNHALVDGNKRLGWLATATFLEINGVTVTGIPNDDVYAFVMDVTAGHQDVAEIGEGLRKLADARAEARAAAFPSGAGASRPGGVIGVDLSEPGSEFAFLEEVAEDAGLPWRGPPAIERRVLELAGGGSLAAIAWGEAGAGDGGGAGHDLVFLHGGAQNSHTWDTTLLALARPVIAIDLPGHGLSSWREDGRYAPEVIASDVRRGVETWAPAPRAVVGFSLGGLTALALAAEAPSLVPALVLVDVSPGPGAPGAPSPVPSLASTPDGWASREELWELATAAWPARSARSLRRGIVHNTTVRDDGRVVWRHHFGNMTGGPGSFDIDRARLWAALERVPGPVMLVRGGASTVVSDDDEAELRSRRPDAAVHVLDGLGHDIPGEAPLVLAGLIEEFLGDREGVTN